MESKQEVDWQAFALQPQLSAPHKQKWEADAQTASGTKGKACQEVKGKQKWRKDKDQSWSRGVCTLSITDAAPSGWDPDDGAQLQTDGHFHPSTTTGDLVWSCDG